MGGVLVTVCSTDRALGARLLRQLRESRGWSQADMAKALRDTAHTITTPSQTHINPTSIQRNIARWESPTQHTIPGEQYQHLLALLYARTPTGTIALGPGSDFDTLLTALHHYGTPPNRIEHLTTLITRTVTGNGVEPSGLVLSGFRSGIARSLVFPARLDETVLDELALTVKAVAAQVGAGGFVQLRLQLAPVVEVCRRLMGISRLGRSMDMLALSTDVFALAARLAFETGDDPTAMALYAEAAVAAGQSGDLRRRAAVRTSHAMVALHSTNDPAAARDVARAAVDDACEEPSSALLARACAVHAEICARAGKPYSAHRDLERAWASIGQFGPNDAYSGFTAGRLDGFDGLCALHSGDPRRARDRLDRSLSTLDKETATVQFGIVSSDLALAHLRLGDPQACVEILHTAVDIAARTGGRVPIQRIRLVRRELRQWRAEDFVANLDDHLHETLLGR